MNQNLFAKHERPTINGHFFSNPLPDNKILDWSKWKQITDNILKWI